jgi:hypothetical protein
MAKTWIMIDKVALRQKGWRLFAAVLALQVIFLVAGYFLTGYL